MMTTQRTTKYTRAVMSIMQKRHHATNAEIHNELLKEYPDVSDTTVHRVTARMAMAGALAHAPIDEYGNYRYDINTEPHHHFYCRCCNSLRDIQLGNSVLKEIESSIGGCSITSPLLISGSCQKCIITKKGESL